MTSKQILRNMNPPALGYKEVPHFFIVVTLKDINSPKK